MTHNERLSVLWISCDGNTLDLGIKNFDLKPKNFYCSHCDLVNAHACLICEQEIEDENVCKAHEGLCRKCWNKEE